MLDFLAGVPGKLKTIYTHLTTNLASARCAKIDNLDATVSSRATPANVAAVASMQMTGIVKSIQHVALAIADTASAGTVAITTVVVNKSVVIPLGARATMLYTVGFSNWGYTLTLTENYLTATRSGSSGAITAIRAVIVEFY